MEQLHNQLFSAMLDSKALCFGDFTLKSGRKSPYFFNSGSLLAYGNNLDLVSRAFAQHIAELVQAHECDYLFGPAYKGIALTAATATTLAQQHNITMPWGYNRKEAKLHGEGGQLVGAVPQGKIVLLDDVLTSGKAATQAIEILAQNNVQPTTLLLLFDRQEAGPNGQLARKELANKYGLQICSLARLDDLIGWLDNNGMQQQSRTLQHYAATSAT